MARLQANTGLVTGIDIAGTVDKLIALQAQPRDRLTAKVKALQAKQTAMADLTASVIGVQLSVKNIGKASLFHQTSVTSSNASTLSAVAGSSNSAAPGEYKFTPIRLAQTQQLLSRAFASKSTALGAGTITLREGGQLADSIALAELNGGAGVERGKIKITDRSGSTAVVDLRFAYSIDDVLEAINTNEDIQVRAVAQGDSIQLIDQTGQTDANLRVQEVGSTSTAADLGLGSINVAANSATGNDIRGLYNELNLSRLNDSTGLSLSSTQAELRVNLRDGTSLDLDFLLAAQAAGNAKGTTDAASGINGDIKLTADSTGASYDDVQLVFTSSGSVTAGNETVSYNSGTKVLTVDIEAGVSTADNVIAAINADATASPLFTASRGTGSNGTGLVTVGDSATLSGGAAVAATTETTLEDLLETINAANPAKLQAEISSSGDRLIFHDLSTDNGNTFSITDLNDGTLSHDLGITTSSGGTITSQRILGGLQSPLLNSLNGGRGLGALGSLTLTDRSGATASVDLASAETVDDVLLAINNAGLGVTAELNGSKTGIRLVDTTGSTTSNFIIANGDATNTATKLGIETNAASIEKNGSNLKRQTLHENTKLSSLNRGQGVPLGSFTIKNKAGQTGAINLTQLGAETLGDVIDAIDNLGININARINDTGDGLVLIDNSSGSGNLRVQDSGSGTSAQKLKLIGDTNTGIIDGSFAKTITLDADDTLTDLATKINDLDAGLAASILSDPAGALPHRLSLASEKSGNLGNFTIDEGSLNLGLNEILAGRDALVALGASGNDGGVLLTSSSNTFTNAVEGVSITLNEADRSTVTVSVKRDSTAIVTKVKAFVDQYNKLQDKLASLNFYNADDGSRGILFASRETLQISGELSRTLSRRYFANNSVSYLTSLGLNFTSEGKLQLDEAKFNAAYERDPTNVEDFFVDSEKGFAKAIDKVTESLAGVDNSTLINGSIALQATIESVNERISAMSARLDRSKERMLKQFYNLETSIGKLQNTFGSIQTTLNNATSLYASLNR